MKFNLLCYLGLVNNFITGQAIEFDSEKPLHIGISLTVGSRSHIKYLFEISELLSQRGHKITYLSTNPSKRFAKGYNVTHYSVGDTTLDTKNLKDIKPFTKGSNIFLSFGKLVDQMAKMYDESFPKYEEFYKSQKPDLIICDFVATSCIESAAKHAVPLMVGYQSLMFAGKSPYLTIGGGFEPTTIENFSFLERMKHATIDPLVKLYRHLPTIKALGKMKKKYGVPNKKDILGYANMGMGIANSYIGLENPTSISSHITTIGPILADNIPALPSDIQEFLDINSKVLYVAFGSMVYLKPELVYNLFQHFQRALNDDIVDAIVWGGLANTNLDKLPKSFTVDSVEYSIESIINGDNKKFKLLKWAPQESILHHPHTKLFMTHGGLDSIYESIQSGTPMLIMPFFGDQPRNAMLVQENGLGDYIEWPIEGDKAIYQKFVKLLDSNNDELKLKMRQFQLISKYNSKRKVMAADLIETYAFTAQSCRSTDPAKPFEIPCEVKPFLPLDQRMSSFKANLIDVYIVASLILLALVSGTIWITIQLSWKLYKNVYKQKLD